LIVGVTLTIRYVKNLAYSSGRLMVYGLASIASLPVSDRR
jgi:hypothetical protein